MSRGFIDATKPLQDKLVRNRNNTYAGLDESTIKALGDLKKQLKTYSKNELCRMVATLLVEKSMQEQAAKNSQAQVDSIVNDLKTEPTYTSIPVQSNEVTTSV